MTTQFEDLANTWKMNLMRPIECKTGEESADSYLAGCSLASSDAMAGSAPKVPTSFFR